MIRCEMKQNCLKLAFDGSYANLNVDAKTPHSINTNFGGRIIEGEGNYKIIKKGEVLQRLLFNVREKDIPLI